MNKQIVNALRELGVPANLMGYEYLKTAIGMCMEDKTCINRLTTQLYPDVAKIHDTTSSRTERAIRHAIEVAWSRGNVDTIQRYFGYAIDSQRGKPTNSEFIATVAEQLRMEQEESA